MYLYVNVCDETLINKYQISNIIFFRLWSNLSGYLTKQLLYIKAFILELIISNLSMLIMADTAKKLTSDWRHTKTYILFFHIHTQNIPLIISCPHGKFANIYWPIYLLIYLDHCEPNIMYFDKSKPQTTFYTILCNDHIW